MLAPSSVSLRRLPTTDLASQAIVVLAALVLGTPSPAHAVLIRDDRPDASYQALAKPYAGPLGADGGPRGHQHLAVLAIVPDRVRARADRRGLPLSGLGTPGERGRPGGGRLDDSRPGVDPTGAAGARSASRAAASEAGRT